MALSARFAWSIQDLKASLKMRPARRRSAAVPARPMFPCTPSRLQVTALSKASAVIFLNRCRR